MKSRNLFTNAEGMPKIVFQSDISLSRLKPLLRNCI